MRFLLDECIPREVARRLRQRRHWCRTLQEARRSGGPDSEQAAYAESIDAVIVSGDKDFYKWRQTHVFGFHVLLDCPKREMAGLLERMLDELIKMIEQFGEGLYRVSQEGVTFDQGRPYRRRR